MYVCILDKVTNVCCDERPEKLLVLWKIIGACIYFATSAASACDKLLSGVLGSDRQHCLLCVVSVR